MLAIWQTVLSRLAARPHQKFASARMEEFVRRYTEDSWQICDDESNTKVYAMEYILETLKANPKAINDVKAFQTTMDTFFRTQSVSKRGQSAEICRGTRLFGQKTTGRHSDGGQRIPRWRISNLVL